MILNSNVRPRNVPAPSDGLDNLQVAKKAVCYVESSKLRPKSLSKAKESVSGESVKEAQENHRSVERRTRFP